MGNLVDKIDDLAECIAASQDAALGTCTWEILLQRLASTFPGTKVAIASKQLEPLRSIGLVTYGYDADIVRDYEEHYSRINPWTAQWRNIPSLKASASDDVLPSHQFKGSEFYEFILRSGEAESASGLKLFEDSNSIATLALHYGTRQADKYNVAIPRFLDALAPYLKLAVQINARLAILGDPAPTLEQAVHQYRTAAFLVDHLGNLLTTNSPGEALLAEGRVAALLHGEHLWIGEDEARSRLGRLIGPNDQVKGKPTVLQTRCAWQFFTFTPGFLDRRVAWMPHEKQWVLAVFEPAVERPSVLERAQRFGLTRQETRVAAALVDGLRVDAVAHALGISSATVRQHIKSIFAKTNTHRQAELIAKLISGP